MQLGVPLGRLAMAGLEQAATREHRVGLGDLAAEKLDGEGGHLHWPDEREAYPQF